MIGHPVVSSVKKCVKMLGGARLWRIGAIAFVRFSGLIPVLFLKKRVYNNFLITHRIFTSDELIIREILVDDLYRVSEMKFGSADTIIDIGAQIGIFALQCSRRVPRGKIFAYEPFEGNVRLLKKNISDNGVTNVFVFCEGVSDAKRKRRLFISAENTGGHSYIAKPSRRYVEINCVALQDVFESNKVVWCDLLKLDCEGAEYDIIYSAPDDCLRRIGKIVLEYHVDEVGSNSLQELCSYLESKNFSVTSKKLSLTTGLLWAHNHCEPKQSFAGV